MQVITESYVAERMVRWSYSLVSGRPAKRLVLSTSSGFRSKEEAKSAGDTLLASLVMRAMVKRSQGAGRRVRV
jgi:hypothetical protein